MPGRLPRPQQQRGRFSPNSPAAGQPVDTLVVRGYLEAGMNATCGAEAVRATGEGLASPTRWRLADA